MGESDGEVHILRLSCLEQYVDVVVDALRPGLEKIVLGRIQMEYYVVRRESSLQSATEFPSNEYVRHTVLARNPHDPITFDAFVATVE